MRVKAISVVNPKSSNRLGTSPCAHRSSAIEGLRRIGVEVLDLLTPPRNIKHVACWGWRNGAIYKSRGHDVLVLERGYIGDRFKYTSLGWNGLNNYASFPDYPDDGGERFKEHGGVLKPWKTGGDYILILGQVKGDASLQGRDISDWYARVAKECQDKYKMPVYFRPHPDSKRRGGYHQIPGIKTLPGTLEESIGGALFTVSYNSNSCLDSILMGTPCYAGDRGTMAWDLCMKDLGQIIRPEREPIVHKIAWTQWTCEEMQTGEPLRALCA